MSKLKFIHFCEKAFFDDKTGNLNLIGIFENILSEKFPTSYSFSVAIGIDTDPGWHTGKIIIKIGEKEIIKTAENRIETKKALRWNNRFNNLIFKEPGKYILEVYFDNNLLGSSRINLIKK